MPAEGSRKPRVVVDTNVIISALNYKGKPREVFDLLRQGELEFCFSYFILEEIKTVLVEDFGWSDSSVQEVIQELTSRGILVEPKTKLKVIKGNDDDNRILECAVEGKAGFIISGDKRHILPLGKYEGIQVLSPDGFLRQWGRR